MPGPCAGFAGSVPVRRKSPASRQVSRDSARSGDRDGCGRPPVDDGFGRRHFGQPARATMVFRLWQSRLPIIGLGLVPLAWMFGLPCAECERR